MGGRVVFSWPKEGGCEAKGDIVEVELKLSNGFASGGDIRLATGGRRFIFVGF
jgi:hypothetical protein